MRDLVNNLHFKPAFAPGAAVTNDTQIVSAILDLNGVSGAALAFITGTNADADATYTVLLEESDDSGMSGANAVADVDLIGTELLAGYTFADDAECRKLGYRGHKRYIRATITSANNTGNTFVGGMWVLSTRSRPTANPPQ